MRLNHLLANTSPLLVQCSHEVTRSISQLAAVHDANIFHHVILDRYNWHTQLVYWTIIHVLHDHACLCVCLPLLRKPELMPGLHEGWWSSSDRICDCLMHELLWLEQARHPNMPSDQDCAGKHGDDDNLVKAQASNCYMPCLWHVCLFGIIKLLCSTAAAWCLLPCCLLGGMQMSSFWFCMIVLQIAVWWLYGCYKCTLLLQLLQPESHDLATRARHGTAMRYLWPGCNMVIVSSLLLLMSFDTLHDHTLTANFVILTQQVDPRLPQEAQERFKKRLADLFKTRKVDGALSSSVLAKAYHDVTRTQILNQ